MELGRSTRNIFKRNLYWGDISGLVSDVEAISRDPGFTSMGDQGTGWKPWLNFILKENSPAVDAGMMLKEHPEENIRGVNIAGRPDIGPLEYKPLRPVR